MTRLLAFAAYRWDADQWTDPAMEAMQAGIIQSDRSSFNIAACASQPIQQNVRAACVAFTGRCDLCCMGTHKPKIQ
eukprot:70853-Chlamydomonas_euryale.AAC.11